MSEPLDDIDRVIARELVADGRATLAHLAEIAGLSVSAVQSRVRRLESRGVVAGTRPGSTPKPSGTCCRRSWPSPLSIPLNPMMLLRASNTSAIESCHSVAGEESYVLLVRVESARALEDLLQRIRTAANVRTRSTIILQTFYDRRDSVP